MVLAPAYRPHSQGTRVTALTPAMLARCVSARIGCPVLSLSSRAIVESTSYSGASLIVGLSGSCSTEKFLACASALPTAMLTVVRRSRLVTPRGSPKFRSRLARSRSDGRGGGPRAGGAGGARPPPPPPSFSPSRRRGGGGAPGAPVLLVDPDRNV